MSETQPVSTEKPDILAAEPVNLEVKSEEEKVNQPNPLAEQFQRIAKQEKFVSDERRKLEAAKKELEVEREAVKSYNQLKGKNPFEILEHFGITYEQLLQADKERSNPIDANVKRALDRVKELESKIVSKEEHEQTERISKAEIQLKADIDAMIVAKEYDLIDKLGAKDSVIEYMEEMYDNTGVIPPLEEACEAVTAFIVEQYSSIKESKWLRPKEEPKVELKATEPVQSNISNKMTQTSEVTNNPQTDEDRMRAAIAAMEASSSGRKALRK